MSCVAITLMSSDVNFLYRFMLQCPTVSLFILLNTSLFGKPISWDLPYSSPFQSVFWW